MILEQSDGEKNYPHPKGGKTKESASYFEFCISGFESRIDQPSTTWTTPPVPRLTSCAPTTDLRDIPEWDSSVSRISGALCDLDSASRIVDERKDGQQRRLGWLKGCNAALGTSCTLAVRIASQSQW